MQTATEPSGFQISQLNAINIAKAITVVCLVGMAIVYGVNDVRQAIYLCLHISYCTWWLLEQWLFPQRAQQIFTEKVGVATLIFSILYIGVYYSLPGYFAFTNPEPIGNLTIGIALPLYIIGSLINTGADIQKTTAKGMGSGLVRDGIWRSVRHVNYLGDLLRYISFSVVAGSLWAYVVSASIFMVYLNLMSKKEASMAEKYSDFAEYKDESKRLFPWIW